jgi:hypothetical protein
VQDRLRAKSCPRAHERGAAAERDDAKKVNAEARITFDSSVRLLYDTPDRNRDCEEKGDPTSRDDSDKSAGDAATGSPQSHEDAAGEGPLLSAAADSRSPSDQSFTNEPRIAADALTQTISTTEVQATVLAAGRVVPQRAHIGAREDQKRAMSRHHRRPLARRRGRPCARSWSGGALPLGSTTPARPPATRPHRHPGTTPWIVSLLAIACLALGAAPDRGRGRSAAGEPLCSNAHRTTHAGKIREVRLAGSPVRGVPQTPQGIRPRQTGRRRGTRARRLARRFRVWRPTPGTTHAGRNY